MFPIQLVNMNCNGRELALAVCIAFISIGLLQLAAAQPSPKASNEISDEITLPKANEDEASKEAEQSFRQFIDSTQTNSTIIGELKPNASASELMALRNKIADTILSMQEKEQKRQRELEARQKLETAECYIEVTRVEKIPGKCKRANGGQPICQSSRLMSITNECS